MKGERTTNLLQLQSGVKFTWGNLIKIHEVGEYSIVEYHPQVFKDGAWTGEISETEIEYHCYVNGKDCCISCSSFDEALATCIAYKHEGANCHANYYFIKMITRKNDAKN